jgi:UDP-N-acetylglucosamine 2-epimerase (non-hydrolysing)
MVVYGTRPEAIKVAPIVAELHRSAHLDPYVVVTGQHRDMLDQVNRLFGITPDRDLDVLTPRQTLEQITGRVLSGLGAILRDREPDLVIVQGDTTTAFAAALAAFYEKIPVIHVEAGLRTGDLHSPFPEEANRRLTAQLAALHLAPTQVARGNLLAEKIEPTSILVTGNTVIDALLIVARCRLPYDHAALERAPSPRVLVTAHRRESWGEPMAQVAKAVAQLAAEFPHVSFVIPAHANPIVRDVLLPPVRGLANVIITDPLPYGQFARLMQDSTLILTDSGGVQEEGPSLGKPVLVMRDSTERPEGVAAGTARLIGTDQARIVDEVSRLPRDQGHYERMANAVNPYGDGRAAQRSVQAIEHFLGLAPRPDEFDPSLAAMPFSR